MCPTSYANPRKANYLFTIWEGGFFVFWIEKRVETTKGSSKIGSKISRQVPKKGMISKVILSPVKWPQLIKEKIPW